MKVTLLISVPFPENRTQDAKYMADVQAQAYPTPGMTYIFYGHYYQVDSVIENLDHANVFAQLRPENQTFKHPERFEKICKKLEGHGFHRITAQDYREIKRVQ